MSTQRNCCCQGGGTELGLQASCLGGDKFFTRTGDVPHQEKQMPYPAFGDAATLGSIGYDPNYGTTENLSNPEEWGINNGNSCMLCTNVLVQKNSNFPYSAWGQRIFGDGGMIPLTDGGEDPPVISGDHLAALDLYYGILPDSFFEDPNLRRGLKDSVISTFNFKRVISLNPSDEENPTIDFPIHEDQELFKNSYLRKLEEYKVQNKYHAFHVTKKKKKLKAENTKIPYYTTDKENQNHVGLNSDYAILDYTQENSSMVFLFTTKEKRDEFISSTEYIDIKFIDSNQSQYRSKKIIPIIFKSKIKKSETYGAMVLIGGEQDGENVFNRTIAESKTKEKLKIVLWGFKGNADPDVPTNIVGSEEYVNRSALEKEAPPETNDVVEIINPTSTCCHCDGTCTENVTEEDCVRADGHWYDPEINPDISCEDLPEPCRARGACCITLKTGAQTCDDGMNENECTLKASDVNVEKTKWHVCGYCSGSSTPSDGGEIIDCDEDYQEDSILPSGLGSWDVDRDAPSGPNQGSSQSTSSERIDDPIDVDVSIGVLIEEEEEDYEPYKQDDLPNGSFGGAEFYYVNQKTNFRNGGPIYTLFHHVVDYWYFDWGRDLFTDEYFATPAGKHGIAKDSNAAYGATEHFQAGWNYNIPFTYPGGGQGQPLLTQRYNGAGSVYGYSSSESAESDPGTNNPIDPVDLTSTNDQMRPCLDGISNVNLVCHPWHRKAMDPRSVWTLGGDPANEWGDASMSSETIENLRSAASAYTENPDTGELLCTSSQVCPHIQPANFSGYWTTELESGGIDGGGELVYNQGGNRYYTATDVETPHYYQWAGNGIHSVCVGQGECLGTYGFGPYQSTSLQTAYTTNGKSGLSDWQVATMAADQDSRWLLDIMSYADGKPVFWSPFHNKKANLYDCLVGVMHRMRVFVRSDFWTESLSGPFMTCPDDPFGVCYDGFGANEEEYKPHTFYPPVVNAKMQASAEGCQTCFINNEDPTCPYKDFVKYCTTPKYWIYKCAGVPIFDFELWGLMLEGKINQSDISDLRNPPHLNRTYLDELDKLPAYRQIGGRIQEIGDKLHDAGILDIRDWREEQRYLYRTWDRFLESGNRNLPDDDPFEKRYEGLSNNVGGIPSSVWGNACCFIEDDLLPPICNPEIDSPEACDNVVGGNWRDTLSLAIPPISGDSVKSELLPIRKRSVVFIKDEDDIDFDPSDKIGLHFVSREIYENALQQTNQDGPTEGLYDPTDLRDTNGDGTRDVIDRVGRWGTASGIQPLTPDLINNKTVDGGRLRLSGEMPVYNCSRYNKNPFREPPDVNWPAMKPSEIVHFNGFSAAGQWGLGPEGALRDRTNDPRWLPYRNENHYYDAVMAYENLDPNDFPSEEEYNNAKEIYERSIEEQKNLIRYYKIYLANNPIYLHAKPGGWSSVPITRPTEWGLIGSIQPWNLLSETRGGPYALLDFYNFENAPCWRHGPGWPSIAYPYGTQFIRFGTALGSFDGIPQLLPRANTVNPRVGGWSHPFRECLGERCTLSQPDPCQPETLGSPCSALAEDPQLGLGPGGCNPGLSQYGGCNSMIVVSNNFGVRILERATFGQGTCKVGDGIGPGTPPDCTTEVPADDFWRSYYQETIVFPFDQNCIPSDLYTESTPLDDDDVDPDTPTIGIIPEGIGDAGDDQEDDEEDDGVLSGGDPDATKVVGCIERVGEIYNNLIPRPNNLHPEHDWIWLSGRIETPENAVSCGDDPCRGDDDGCFGYRATESCPSPCNPNAEIQCCGISNQNQCNFRRCDTAYFPGGVTDYGVDFDGPDSDWQGPPHGWYIPWIMDYNIGEQTWGLPGAPKNCGENYRLCPRNRIESNIQPSPVAGGWGAKYEGFPSFQWVPWWVTGIVKLPYHCPYSIARRGYSENRLNQSIPKSSAWGRCGRAMDGPPTPYDCYDHGAGNVRTDLQIRTLKRVKTDVSRTLFLDELDGGDPINGYASAFVAPNENSDAEDVEFYCSVYRSLEEYEENGIDSDIPFQHWIASSLPGFREIRFVNIINPMEPHIRHGSKLFAGQDGSVDFITGSPIGWRTFKDLGLNTSDTEVIGGPPAYPGWSPPELPAPVPQLDDIELSDHGSPDGSGIQTVDQPYRFFTLNRDEGRRVGAIIPFGGWFAGGRFLEPDTSPNDSITLDEENNYRPKYLNETVKGDTYASNVAYIHWNAANFPAVPIDPCLQCDGDGMPEGCLVQPGEECPIPVNPARGVIAGLPIIRYDNDPSGNEVNLDMLENYGGPFGFQLTGHDLSYQNENNIGINNRYEAANITPIGENDPLLPDEIDRDDLADGEFRQETVLGMVLFVFNDFASMYSSVKTFKMASMKFEINDESCAEGSNCFDWPLAGRYELTNPLFVTQIDENQGLCDGGNLVPLITNSARQPGAGAYNEAGYYPWHTAYCDSTSETCLNEDTNDGSTIDKYFPNMVAYHITPQSGAIYNNPDDPSWGQTRLMRSFAAPHHYTDINNLEGYESCDDVTCHYDPCEDSPLNDNGGTCMDNWCRRARPEGSPCVDEPTICQGTHEGDGKYANSCSCTGFRNCLEAFYARLHWELQTNKTCIIDIKLPDCAIMTSDEETEPRPICHCATDGDPYSRCSQAEDNIYGNLPAPGEVDGESTSEECCEGFASNPQYAYCNDDRFGWDDNCSEGFEEYLNSPDRSPFCGTLGCGSESAGSCCTAHDTPFCNNQECCDIICEVDPNCCDVDGPGWDELCVEHTRDEAIFGDGGLEICGCQLATGACCPPQDLADAECEEALTADECAIKSQETNSEWTWNENEPCCICDNSCVSGACCIDGTCSIKTQSECEEENGRYQGDNTSCTPNPCEPDPLGACCRNPCPQGQSCCLGENMTEQECDDLDEPGQWHSGKTCAQACGGGGGGP